MQLSHILIFRYSPYKAEAHRSPDPAGTEAKGRDRLADRHHADRSAGHQGSRCWSPRSAALWCGRPESFAHTATFVPGSRELRPSVRDPPRPLAPRFSGRRRRTGGAAHRAREPALPWLGARVRRRSPGVQPLPGAALSAIV